MGHSGDLEFAILYKECTKIAGNFGQYNFQGIPFENFSMEYCVWNLETDTLTLSRLCECNNTYE